MMRHHTVLRAHRDRSKRRGGVALLLAAAALGGAGYLAAPFDGAPAAATDIAMTAAPTVPDAGAEDSAVTQARVVTAALDAKGSAAKAAVKAPVVVGLGDSVPAGSHCSCANFVAAYAAKAAAATGKAATVHNDAVSGSTTADLVHLVATSTVAAQIRSATTVLIMTGANDYNSAFSAVSRGASAVGTYTPVANAVQANVTTIVKKIHSLNGSAHVVVIDYWAAMKDGAVARKTYNAATMKAAEKSTTSVNGALARAAKAGKGTYVSTYVPFKGADGSKDPTSLLASDGDHPDAAGHQVIAKAVFAVLPKG